MHRILLTSVVAAAFAAAPAQAVTIINGGFDAAPAPNPYQTVAAGQNSIAGWTVGGASVEWIGNYWQSHDGTNSIDLAGAGIGSVAQDLLTDLGQAYRVTFWVSANPDAGINPRTGFVDVGGAATQYTFTNTPFNRSDMNWQKMTYDFVGTGGTQTLRFSADPATSQGYYGLALDAVSIAAVPEPGIWAMMILGFGLIGGTMRSRRRKVMTYAAA